MKNTLHNSITMGLIIASVFAACKGKDYNNVNAGAAVSFTALKSTPQTILVTAGKESTVYGAEGTQLHFYSNSFVDAKGNPITSGTVTVQLTEMYKPGEMIRNAATTISNGQILQSGGQINISATVDGQTVYTNGYGLGFPRTTATTQPMSLFYGSTNTTSAVTTWTQSDSTNKANTAMGAPSGFYHFDSCKKFTWANCDWFYQNDSPKTTVKVILPDSTFNATNTSLYLVLPVVTRGSNTADTFTAVLSNTGDRGLGGASYNSATKTLQLISEGNTSIVPAGLKYDLVVITCKKNSYYYFKQSGVIADTGVNVKANFTPYTQDQIISQLSSL